MIMPMEEAPKTPEAPEAPKTILKESSSVPVAMPRSILKPGDTPDSIKNDLNEILKNRSKSNPNDPKHYAQDRIGHAEDQVGREEAMQTKSRSPEIRNMVQELIEKSKSVSKIAPSEFKKSQEADDEEEKKTPSKRKKHRRHRSKKSKKSVVESLSIAADTANVLHQELEHQTPLVEGKPLLEENNRTKDEEEDQPLKSILKHTESKVEPQPDVKESQPEIKETITVSSTTTCVRVHTIDTLKAYIGEPVETKVAIVALGIVVVGIAVYFSRAAKL